MNPSPEHSPPSRGSALAALLLTLFWGAGALVARGDRKDLFYQWALARLAAQEPATAYSAEALATLSRGRTGSELDPSSRFHVKTGAVPYPPPHPLLYAPLGRLELRTAAAAMGLADLALAWAIVLIASGCPGVPWRPRVLLVLLLLFPGYYYNLALGQNALVTSLLLVAGWRLLASGDDVKAGAVLALLSYKPQWLIAAGWLVIAMRRPRACLGLLIGLGGIGAATLALFGPEIWSAWLPAARYAAQWYGEAPAQLGMALDLRALVVRLVPSQSGNAAGFLLLGATGLAGALLLGGRAAKDPAARAGLLLAALLVAPHVMYYDLTVFLLPVGLLAVASHGWPDGLRRAARGCALLVYVALPIMSEWPGPERHAFVGPPLATFALLGLLLTTVLATRASARR